MSNTRTSQLNHPFMLDDLTENCQRMSASLPPDGWEPELPAIRVEREETGLLISNITQSDETVSGVGSARSRPSADSDMKKTRTQEEDRVLLAHRDRNEDGDQCSRGADEVEGTRTQCKEHASIWRRICCYPCLHCRRPDSTGTTTDSSRSIFRRLVDNIKRLWQFDRETDKESNVWWKRKGRKVSGNEPLLKR